MARARLSGRPLQPWRAVLGVALWLEQYGVEGLHGRLEQLALAYQAERPELEADDLTTLVVRVLMYQYQQYAQRSMLPGPLESIAIHMSEIQPMVQALSPQPTRSLTPQRIGAILTKLRVGRAPRHEANQGRQWLITRDDVIRWAKSYGVLTGARGDDEAENERGPLSPGGKTSGL